MALHEQLWPRVTKAARGQFHAPNPALDEASGSRNYIHMARGSALLSAWGGAPGWSPAETAKARAAWLADLLAEQNEGHLSRSGPKGIQNEQGAPDPHWKFHALPIAAVWRAALKKGDAEVAAACECWWGAELFMAGLLNFEGVTLEPGGRVKDEKGQYLSESRDVALAALRGERPPGLNRGPKWWSSDDGLAVSILVEIWRDHPETRQRLLGASEPKLRLPVHKAELSDGGYVAWIEDTEDARRQLGNDALSWVKIGPDGIDLGYDWIPLPEIPEEAAKRIYGGSHE